MRCSLLTMEDAHVAAIRALGAEGLYEDNHLLVVNKPAGVLAQAAQAGDDNLVDRARAYLKLRYAKPGGVFVGLVHRLDRNVSGATILARTSKAAKRLHKAFVERSVHKEYLAVVVGGTPPRGLLEHHLRPRPKGRRGVEAHVNGRLARLRFERLATAHERTVLRVVLETGRKHQIRAQLALAGFPLVGDPLYGRRAAVIRRPALHAHRLAFEHPVRKDEVSLTAPIPVDLCQLLSDCGFDMAERAVFTE